MWSLQPLTWLSLVCFHAPVVLRNLWVVIVVMVMNSVLYQGIDGLSLSSTHWFSVAWEQECWKCLGAPLQMMRNFLSPPPRDTGTPYVKCGNTSPDHATLVSCVRYIHCCSEVTTWMVVLKGVWRFWVNLVVQNVTTGLDSPWIVKMCRAGSRKFCLVGLTQERCRCTQAHAKKLLDMPT